MKILSLKIGEAIVIDDKIKIIFRRMQSNFGGPGSGVVLDVDAPRDVRVYREEIYESMKSKGGPTGKPERPIS